MRIHLFDLWVNNGFAQILTLNIIDSIECGEVIEDTGCKILQHVTMNYLQ